MRSASGRNVSPAVAPAETSSGVVLELRADHADRGAIDDEHLRRLEPVGGLPGRGLDDVGGQERELRPGLLLRRSTP